MLDTILQKTEKNDMKVKLSIVVLTMNRKLQLLRAIQSCLNCLINCKFEIIVIDNGSTDNSIIAVEELLKTKDINYQLFVFENNSGVGKGRNKGFEMAKGDYVYFLDDDAEIDPESYIDFFVLPIMLFEEDPKVVTISTRIFDVALDRFRIPQSAKFYKNGVYKVLMYQGGSHFIRAAFFQNKKLYGNILYGYEEIEPSLRIIKKKSLNCFLQNVGIIHKPEVNKWIDGSDIMVINTINEFARIAATKGNIYPKLFKPLLLVFMFFRWRVHLAPHGVKFANCLENYRKFKLDFIGFQLNEIEVLRLILQFGLRSTF
jgi:glycosyltransferase involved in cell wall biosynthesis